ncbi:MAG: hypothetical protein QM781_17170 [Chitinophagaceae bacterium]
MITVKYPIAVICTFLWAGFVCAISFMEAWLKFQAPGITVSLGLGIGKLVFAALNKIEWILAAGILANLLLERSAVFTWANLLFALTVLLLLIQTCWLLPALDARATNVIQGMPVKESNLHFYYIAIETVKIAFLMLFGAILFKRVSQP